MNSHIPRCVCCNSSYANLEEAYDNRVNNGVNRKRKIRLPYSLSCGNHTVCSFCFDKSAQMIPDGNGNDSGLRALSIKCSNCKEQRSMDLLCSNNLNIDFQKYGEAWYYELHATDGAYLNYMNINGLLEVNTNQSETEMIRKEVMKQLDLENAIIKCGNCKQQTAEMYCYDCQMLFCVSCKFRHETHSSVYNSNLRYESILCAKHVHQSLRNYCLTCNKYICMTCLFSGIHDGHDKTESRNVDYVRQKYSNHIKAIEQQLNTTIRLLDDKIDRVKCTTQQSLGKLNANKSEKLSKIDHMACDNINSHIEDKKHLMKKLQEIKIVYEEVTKLMAYDNALFKENHKKHLGSIEPYLQPAPMVEKYFQAIDKKPLSVSQSRRTSPNSQTASSLKSPKKSMSECGRPSKGVYRADELLEISTNFTCDEDETTEQRRRQQQQSTPKQNTLMSKFDSNNNLAQSCSRNPFTTRDDLSSVDMSYDMSMNNMSQMDFSITHSSFTQNDVTGTTSDSDSGIMQSQVQQFPNAITIRCDKLRLNTEERVRVVYYESTSAFWVRRVGDFGRYRKMMDEIGEHMKAPVSAKSQKNHNSSCRTTVQIGDYVIHATKEKLYRAQIIDIRENPEEESQTVKVRYIDMGQMVACSTTELFNLHKKFLSYPAFATRCRLHKLQVVNTDRLRIVGYIFTMWCKNKIVEMKVIDECDVDYYDVELQICGNEAAFRKISRILVENRLATVTGTRVDDVLMQNDAAFDLNKVNYVFMKKFQDNTTVEAIMSSLECISEFHLRFFEDKEIEERLAQINMKICQDFNFFDKHTVDEFIFIPRIGQECAALSAHDNRWYRGVIVSVSERMRVDVLFVDYGNVERVSLSNVRIIKPDYLKFTVNTFKCKLYGLVFDESKLKLATDFMAEQIIKVTEQGHQNLTVQIINIDEVTRTHYVVVFVNDNGSIINLNALIEKFNYAQCDDPYMLQYTNSIIEETKNTSNDANKVEMPKMPIKPTKLETEAKNIQKTFDNKILRTKPDNSFLHWVSNVLSPNEIWIQEKINLKQNLDILNKRLSDFYKKLMNGEIILEEQEDEPEKKWKCGDLCVFKHAKRMDFYRGKIVDTRPSDSLPALHEYKVICLDNGIYTDNVKAENLFQLTDAFKTPEFLAKKCFLSDVVPCGAQVKGEWTNMAKQFLTDVLLDHEVNVVFKNEIKASGGDVTDTIYEIDISVDITPKKENELFPTVHVFESYVKFADILCNKGLAFSKAKKEAFETKLLSTVKTYHPFEIDLRNADGGGGGGGLIGVLTHFGTRHISVLLKKHEQSLRTFEAELTGYYEKPINQIGLKRFDNRQACILRRKHKASGKMMYCRVKIAFLNEYEASYPSLKDDVVRIFAIDYGFDDIVQKSDLFEPVQKEHLTQPAFVVNLDLIEFLNKQKIGVIYADELNKMCNMKQFKIHLKSTVLNSNEMYLFRDLEFTSNKIFLSDFLKKQCQDTGVSFDTSSEVNETIVDEMQSDATTVGEVRRKFKKCTYNFGSDIYYPIIITEVESLNKLNIILRKEADLDLTASQKQKHDYNEMRKQVVQLEILEEKLQTLKSQLKRMRLIEENKPCLSVFSTDSKLYRAVILEHGKSQATVRYVDYGNTEVVNLDNIFEIPDEYLDLPVNSVRGILRYTKYNDLYQARLNAQVYDVIINKMNEIVNNNTTTTFARFLRKINDDYDIEVYVNNPTVDKYAFIVFNDNY